MKRLLSYLMLAISVIVGCKSGGDEKTKSASDSLAILTSLTSAANVTVSGTMVKKTLNNIDSTRAKEWIENYQISKAITAVENASYFLNERMVEKILAYLSKESSEADGIRFYLAKESSTDVETMLLLVSTKAGADSNKHIDYYEHDRLLFDTARVVTLRVNKKGTDPGAVLYDSCPTCPDLKTVANLQKELYPEAMPKKWSSYLMVKI